MSTPEHTLDDLARATGFSKRQIRFYITKKLVPGAGASRGPNATYGEETLRRLQLIGVLKDLKIEPTGRTMTLDEIGHSLDTLSADGMEALLGGYAELKILDTDAGRREPLESAAEYLRDIRGLAPSYSSMEMPMRHNREPEYLHEIERCSFLSDFEGGEPLTDTLSRLQDLLAELASDSQLTPKATDHPQWLRITTPDLEFHVRQPDDHLARIRLAALAQELARLLEREE